MNTAYVDMGLVVSILSVVGCIIKVTSSTTKTQVLVQMLSKIVEKHESDIDALKDRELQRAIRDQGRRG